MQNDVVMIPRINIAHRHFSRLDIVEHLITLLPTVLPQHLDTFQSQSQERLPLYFSSFVENPSQLPFQTQADVA